MIFYISGSAWDHTVAAKKYEKDRRIRFNALLDRLASVLPDCPPGNPDNKWTKAQVELSMDQVRNLNLITLF